MKTQCPHCQTKFNAPDEHKGKKVKCPKCSELFFITQVFERASVDNCAACGRAISGSEQPCVFKGKIVCEKCDEKLRKGLSSVGSKEVHRPPKGTEQVTGEESSGISIAGLVFGIIWFVFVVFVTVQMGLRLQEDHQQRVPFLFVLSPSLPLLVPAICFICRSFFAGLGLWRAVLTCFAGFLLGCGAHCFLWTIPYVYYKKITLPGFLLMAVLFAVFVFFGIILLRIGFRPKGYVRSSGVEENGQDEKSEE
jgi:predicted Zn finger-like uncharacterized protein